MAKIGRRFKHYESQTYGTIEGLTRQPDGRWRIISGPKAGFRWTEPDEKKAIDRFYAMTNGEVSRVVLSSATLPANHPAVKAAADVPSIHITTEADGKMTIHETIDEKQFFDAMRYQLLFNLDYAAQMCRLPGLVNFRYTDPPKDRISTQALINNYLKNNPSAKPERTINQIKQLVKWSDVTMLDELTIEKLTAYRQHVEEKSQSGGAKAWHFGCIKAVLSFGLKTGMDNVQIRAALDRFKVLWTGQKAAAPKPTPISREDFHALLKAAGTTHWRAWLLVGLNLCLHLGEVCQLRWDTLDLEAGTHAAIRTKTSIARAATLWPETIAALKTLRRTGSPYVFISQFGSAYNRSTRGNLFAQLRKRAGVPGVMYDMIRDGSYTSAVNDPTVAERFARVLAGHRSPGLQDSYVLRNPKCTAVACAAVYKFYGPFPMPG